MIDWILEKFGFVTKKEYDRVDEDRRSWFYAYDAEVQRNKNLHQFIEKNKELSEQIIELKKELADEIQKRYESAILFKRTDEKQNEKEKEVM